ncbi:MAG: bifunctional [glutamine synthetase] adenylyltransferase/[glutamine synthetase]-adenylyl-L-tyrosine phosphorylase [Alphaproteobacteria bacterium]|jgi:glutamate-ammonia-ligase adenylyltransferase|nr:bifunctional [glutamine synthetase] adenylyltransferase/[glutamine synthetase]-adenylyl-L-tyrosine phosphorylase [Alphaproteobacteria bacterium]
MLKIAPIADSLDGVIRLAGAHAPYLERLIVRDGDGLPQRSRELEAAFTGALREIEDLAGQSVDFDAASRRLRQAKRRCHLIIALADLSGSWDLSAVTRALTQLADTSVQAALGLALAQRGLDATGLFVAALGKMGAHELNYSSDIDLAAFYDPDLFDGGKRAPGEAGVRVIRDMARLLDEQTGEGYVFRTDLRLRPDPRSTPVAVSTRMAELYYESVGQNWERMVWIKGRICAGDAAAGAQFLDMIRPFVWRRHLDYWAVSDIHAIKRMINTSVGDPSLSDPAPDVKLGPGGIREIEFFAQTQQLILGGRDERLRKPGTLAALAALTDAGNVTSQTCAELSEAYRALRAVEHRVQMLNDEQTHDVPDNRDRRGDLARLCGYDELEAFDADLRETRRQVHARYSDLFAEEERRHAEAVGGNLVFTGVDNDPGTMRTLEGLGFSRPAAVIDMVRKWHHGAVPATGSRRGQELLTTLLPALLEAMGRTGEADLAFGHFATFIARLRSGVQTLSMLLAEPDLMEDLVATLALAPRLARTLGDRPERLEALLTAEPPERLRLDPELGFEEAMNRARLYHRDLTFLIGHRLLHGRLNAADAAQAWTALADNMVEEMAFAAEREIRRRHGPAPGHWSVMAMGKHGGAELTAGSDLDMIVIYDPHNEAGGEAQSWFTRFTQRLITALSAPTAEGTLYEVDMRLRPSGRSGPVAVRLSAFERYQQEDAWTWEHMALTRLRSVAGNGELGAAALAIARQAIVSRAGHPNLVSDVADMRRRLRQERPGGGLWDLKLAPGGLVDIEFVAQLGMLETGRVDAIRPASEDALKGLGEAGWLSQAECKTLCQALGHLQALQQVLRLAMGERHDEEAFSSGLRERLCRAVGAEDFDTLRQALAELKQAAGEIHQKKCAGQATDS